MIHPRFFICAALVVQIPGVVRAEEAAKPYTVTLHEDAKKKITFDMVPIPAGVFKMGSPATEKERKKDEGPQIEVEVEAFWMGKCEVTWDEFELFNDLGGNVPFHKMPIIPKEKSADAITLPTPRWEQEFRPMLKRMGHTGGYPAANITQLAAKQYTKWLSKKTGHFYRLPTEAEWEYAARAGSTTAYPFGDDAKPLDGFAWHYENSLFDPNLDLGHPASGGAYRKVGQKKPNAWGLFDMHGNVAEWCIDAYVPDHYTKLAGKRVNALDAVAWPTKKYPRVFRGGHWDAPAEDCRTARRFSSDKSLALQDPELPKSLWWYTDAWHVGFRVIRPAKEPSEKEKLRYWEIDAEELQKDFEKMHNSDKQRILIDVEKK